MRRSSSKSSPSRRSGTGRSPAPSLGAARQPTPSAATRTATAHAVHLTRIDFRCESFIGSGRQLVGGTSGRFEVGQDTAPRTGPCGALSVREFDIARHRSPRRVRCHLRARRPGSSSTAQKRSRRPSRSWPDAQRHSGHNQGCHCSATSFIPHFGQSPGEFETTSACMGHRYETFRCAPLPPAGCACEWSAEWPPHPPPRVPPQDAVRATIGRMVKSRCRFMAVFLVSWIRDWVITSA